MDFIKKIINKIKTLFSNKRFTRIFASATVFVLVWVIVALTVFNRSTPTITEDNHTEVTSSNINPDAEKLISGTTAVPQTTAGTTAAAATAQPTTAASTKATAAQTTTMEPPVPFATAVAPAEPADYQSQWDAGYLLAIDNPDYGYGTSTVYLSDADRDLLERLCMGEFGTGGFIGAALIAQAVKDAMCFDGYTNVADVIKYCRYDGSTSMGTNDACRQAVRYIFDDNHDAVQHRLLYMYNPYLVTSSFHESQNFILSYQGVRFFDRW